MVSLGRAERDGIFILLTLLGRACGQSSLSFESALRLVELLRVRPLQQLQAELLSKRFREANDSPFRCMVRRAARPSQAAADRCYLEDAAAPLLAHERYGRTGDVNHATILCS